MERRLPRDGNSGRSRIPVLRLCPHARAKELRAVVIDENRKAIANGKLEGFDEHWKMYETIIRATGTVEKAQLNLFLDEAGIR